VQRDTAALLHMLRAGRLGPSSISSRSSVMRSMRAFVYIGAALTVCGLTVVALLVLLWPFSPGSPAPPLVEPPQCLPGNDAAFDARVAQIHASWRTFFLSEGKLLEALPGGDAAAREVLPEGTPEVSLFAGSFPFSGPPSGHFLVVYVEDARLLPRRRWLPALVDVDRRTLTTLIPPDGFEAVRFQDSVTWLDDRSFLVAYEKDRLRPDGQGYDRIGQLSRYSVDAPDEGHLAVEIENPILARAGLRRLFVASASEVVGQWTVYVIDSGGTRTASESERTWFNDAWGGHLGTVNTAGRITVRPVAAPGACVEDCGDFVESNRGRSYIRLFDRIVRCGTHVDNVFWDEDLGVFIWNENADGAEPRAFIMDLAGNYRSWGEGIFVGKSPRDSS